MDKERLAEVIAEWGMENLDIERPLKQWATALAEHLAAVLPPTVDKLVEVFGLYCKQDGRADHLVLYDDGTGSVRDGDNRHLDNAPSWPNGGSVAAIKAAMKPEPTEKEKALEALEHIVFTAGASADSYAAIVRKALEAK